MYIVEIYRHDEQPYEVLIDQKYLIDIAMVLQMNERCQQFRVHSTIGSPLPVEYAGFSKRNFPKWVTEFDYSL